MEISYETTNDNLRIQTFGGESWVDEYEINEYGISIGDISISDIPSSAFAQLACSMLNHLMTNGHRFAMYTDGDGNKRIAHCGNA